MMKEDTQAPGFWAEELALADQDIARGRVVGAAIVHDLPRTAIATLEAESVAEPPRGH